MVFNWKMAWKFIWTNLSSLHPGGCFVPRLVKICPVEHFWISSIYFHYFPYNIPLKKGVALHFNKFEFPSPMYALIEIGRGVLEKKIVKFHQCIFTISFLSTLGKGHHPSFQQTWCFVLSLDWMGPVVIENKFYFTFISPWEKGGPFI